MSATTGRLIATILVAAAAVSVIASTLSPDGRSRPPGTGRAKARAVLAPATATSHGGWLTARVISPVLLRSSPAGPRIARLGTRTEFGSPRVLSVVRRRGEWLGVTAAEAGNGRLGWVSARRVRLGRVGRSLVIELSRRQLVLRAGDRTVRRVTVGVGSSTSPTPLGRFAVTDRLRMPGTSPYGCCALALSGRQTKLPASWTGGDRLAIHGTADERTIGRATSHGCLHARAADLRKLLRAVPLGAPVFVRA